MKINMILQINAMDVEGESEHGWDSDEETKSRNQGV
jgi:hypothetical protein